MDKEEKDELTCDDTKGQLNKDKSIIYNGQFTKEMFLEFCEELSKPQKIRRQQFPLFDIRVIESISDYTLIGLYNNFDILCSSETYELVSDRLKKLENKLNTKLE